MILSEQVEVSILHNAANLTKTEENNILAIVNITSKREGLVRLLKDALRDVGYRKDKKTKEEVVLLQYECQEDGDQEDVHYGGRYNNRGYQQNNRGYQNYQNPQQQKNFQSNQGNYQQNQGRFQAQKPFRKGLPASGATQQVETSIINAIHEIPAAGTNETVGKYCQNLHETSSRNYTGVK